MPSGCCRRAANPLESRASKCASSFVRFSVERKRHVLYRCATGDDSFTARGRRPGRSIRRARAQGRRARPHQRARGARRTRSALSERDRARVRSGCLRRRRRRDVDQRRDDHWSRPSRLCSSCDRARHRIRDRRRPPNADAPFERHPNRMRAPPHRSSRNIQCAGRQLRHTGRSCAQMIGSTRRWRVGDEHRRERAARRHRATATYRTATADRRCDAAERGSDASVRSGRMTRTLASPTGFARRALAPRVRPASLHIVWACVRYAASVQYQRVTLSDLSAAAGVSERRVRDAFSDCHGMSPTAYLRVAALLRGATRASRRSVRTRSP